MYPHVGLLIWKRAVSVSVPYTYASLNLSVDRSRTPQTLCYLYSDPAIYLPGCFIFLPKLLGLHVFIHLLYRVRPCFLQQRAAYGGRGGGQTEEVGAPRRPWRGTHSLLFPHGGPPLGKCLSFLLPCSFYFQLSWV